MIWFAAPPCKPAARLPLADCVESNIHFPATVSALPGRVRLWAHQRACEAIDAPEVERVTVIKSE